MLLCDAAVNMHACCCMMRLVRFVDAACAMMALHEVDAFV